MYRRVIVPFLACALLALLAYLVYQLARPFLPAVLFGAILAVVAYPVHDWLRRKLGGKEGLAAVLSVLMVLLLFVVPATVLIGSLGKQATDAYHWVGKETTGEDPIRIVQKRLDAYRDSPYVGGAVRWIQRQLESFGENARETLPEAVKKTVQFITTLLTSLLANVLTFLLNLVLSLVAMGIFLTRGGELLGVMARVAPIPRDRSPELFARLGEVMKAVVKGIGLTCIAQGTLGGLGFWVAGIPSPLLFGTLMAFTSLIPVVGTALVWVPGVVYLFLTGQTGWGVGLLLWSALVVGNIDNVLRPLLIGGKAGMPMPLLIVGILGGLVTYGLIGLVIGPMILTVFLFLLEELRAAEADAGPGGPPGTAPGGGERE